MLMPFPAVRAVHTSLGKIAASAKRTGSKYSHLNIHKGNVINIH